MPFVSGTSRISSTPWPHVAGGSYTASCRSRVRRPQVNPQVGEDLRSTTGWWCFTNCFTNTISCHTYPPHYGPATLLFFSILILQSNKPLPISDLCLCCAVLQHHCLCSLLHLPFIYHSLTWLWPARVTRGPLCKWLSHHPAFLQLILHFTSVVSTCHMLGAVLRLGTPSGSERDKSPHPRGAYILIGETE